MRMLTYEDEAYCININFESDFLYIDLCPGNQLLVPIILVPYP